MKILYVGYLTDEETFKIIEDAGIEPSVARFKFESTFIREILKQKEIREELEIVSCVPYNEDVRNRDEVILIDEFPLRCVWWEKKISSFIQGIVSVRKEVDQWYKRTEGQERVIVTYATNPITMLLLFWKKTKVITICSEVPRFRVMTKGIMSAIKKKYYHFLNERMDGYIFFSKHMEEVCNFKRNPSIVVEGLPSIRENQKEFFNFKERPEQIFYAGGLNSENGIVVLLQAFVALERKDVALRLCGTGNVVETVKEYANKYENIEYYGTVPNEQILEYEREATILINPRKADEELTRYSFPSKTFEYFCSGTVSMLTRLEGIPDEYYRFCYECDSSSANALKKDIERVLSIPQQERMKKALEAFEFIIREKTANKQVGKIVNFIKEMSRN